MLHAGFGISLCIYCIFVRRIPFRLTGTRDPTQRGLGLAWSLSGLTADPYFPLLAHARARSAPLRRVKLSRTSNALARAGPQFTLLLGGGLA